MEQNEKKKFTAPVGQLMVGEDGAQYFICGKSHIKVSEHFASASEGKSLSELLEDMIQHTANKAAF